MQSYGAAYSLNKPKLVFTGRKLLTCAFTTDILSY